MIEGKALSGPNRIERDVTNQSLRSRVRKALHVPTGVRRPGFVPNVLLRNLPWNFEFIAGRNFRTNYPILALMRIRDEELLIQDSLDHVATFADGIIVFDDSSTDDTVAIVAKHPSVVEIIRNKKWKSTERHWEETANRRLLLNRSRHFSPTWVFYCDADERFEGDIREYLLEKCPSNVSAIRISLLDAYMTKDDFAGFAPGDTLLNFRQSFGPERRDIIMAWRPSPTTEYFVPDSREPIVGHGDIETRFWCQHYGKSLSVEQWEATCDYYIANFPENYRAKWQARKGKAIHTQSDFGAPLMSWADAKKKSYLLDQ